MTAKKRIVITGLGMVSPVGLTVQDSWSNIIKGISGIATIAHFDVSDFPSRIGGSIRNFDVTQHIRAKEAKKMDPFIHYGIVAAQEAIADAALVTTAENEKRIGVAIGSGIGGLPGIEKGHNAFLRGGPRKISPFFVPSNIINMISGNLSVMYGYKGPNIAIVTACSSGAHSIGMAARMIEYGDVDVMIAGGAEMATSPSCLGGFAAARALSRRNDDPQTASRPWDIDRDGFVLSDGAGVVVLESLEHAQQRDAHIYAELSGFGMTGDAYHMTMPQKEGIGAADCMQMALDCAAINTDQIDYINAHGTSTPAGDIAETIALKRTFSHHAPNIAISSTKSMTGHLLGAAGGIEAIFTILAMRDQVAPPTINLFNQDPACDLDYVPNHAREMKINTALSNSFGFGGTNASLLFRKMA